MRRLAHHLLAALTFLSTLLLAATCTLWLRSYSRSELITWSNARGYRAFYTAQGSLALDVALVDRSGWPQDFHGPVDFTDSPHPPFDYLSDLGSEIGDRYGGFAAAGFEWHQIRNPTTLRLHGHGVVPFWAIVLLSAILPVRFVFRRLRARFAARRRSKPGFCPTCGYDLRATPGRCPECGRMIAPI